MHNYKHIMFLLAAICLVANSADINPVQVSTIAGEILVDTLHHSWGDLKKRQQIIHEVEGNVHLPTFFQRPFENIENIVAMSAVRMDARIITTSENTAYVFQVSSAGIIQSFSHTVSLIAAILSPCGNFALTFSQDNSANLYDVQSADLIKSFTNVNSDRFALAASFAPDSSKFSIGFHNGEIKIYEMSLNTEIITSLQTGGISGRVRQLVYSPDGKYILALSEDHTLVLYSEKTGRVISKRTGGIFENMDHVAFSSDGNRIFLCHWKGNGYRTTVIDLASNREIKFYPEPILISKDETLAVTLNSKKLMNWNGKSKEVLQLPSFGQPIFVDSKTIITISDRTSVQMWLWDATKESMHLLKIFQHTAEVNFVNFVGERVILVSV